MNLYNFIKCLDKETVVTIYDYRLLPVLEHVKVKDIKMSKNGRICGFCLQRVNNVDIDLYNDFSKILNIYMDRD